MAKVKNVEEGIKFKLPSGDVYEVKEFIGKSQAGISDLWLCQCGDIEAVFTDWAICDKQEIK